MQTEAQPLKLTRTWVLKNAASCAQWLITTWSSTGEPFLSCTTILNSSAIRSIGIILLTFGNSSFSIYASLPIIFLPHLSNKAVLQNGLQKECWQKCISIGLA